MKKYPDGGFNGLGNDGDLIGDPIRLLTLHREYRNLTDEFFDDDEEDYIERDID